MKIESNLERIELWKSIYSEACFKSSYLPNKGFAAASTEVLEFRMVVIPALAIEMVYCSIAS